MRSKNTLLKILSSTLCICIFVGSFVSSSLSQSSPVDLYDDNELIRTTKKVNQLMRDHKAMVERQERLNEKLSEYQGVINSLRKDLQESQNKINQLNYVITQKDASLEQLNQERGRTGDKVSSLDQEKQ